MIAAVGLVLPLAAALAVLATAWALGAATAGHRSALAARRLRPPPPPGPPPDWFVRALDASGLHAGAERAWSVTRRSAITVTVVSAWWWPQVVLAVLTAAWVAQRADRRRRERAARRNHDRDLAVMIDAVVSRIATGTSLSVALHDAAEGGSPVAQGLGRALRRHRHGQSLQSAVDQWAVQEGTPGLRLLADSLAIAGRSGGSQRSALVSVQATLRERDAMAREVRALGSQARTSGVVLAVTPAAFAAVVAMVDERVAAFFATPAGWACVLGGLVLNAVGGLWMNRLTEGFT